MKLINTDGMALIGPGSEWFWTALSGIVLGVTFIAIYRQLRLQVSAGANDQAAALERDWLGERLARARLAVLMAIEADPTAMTLPRGSARAVGHFWERVGWLVRAGHMDGRVVHETFGDVSLWWTWLAPFTHRLREEQGDPQIGEHFEWLAGEMDLMTRQQGFFPRDGATATRLVPMLLEENRDAVHLFEALKSTNGVPAAGANDGA